MLYIVVVFCIMKTWIYKCGDNWQMHLATVEWMISPWQLKAIQIVFILLYSYLLADYKTGFGEIRTKTLADKETLQVYDYKKEKSTGRNCNNVYKWSFLDNIYYKHIKVRDKSRRWHVRPTAWNNFLVSIYIHMLSLPLDYRFEMVT